MTDGDLWRDRNKVFVAGLPLHVDDDILYDKFKLFGDMHQSKVVYDQKTGRSRGFGFVTFHDYINALDAVAQMNQSKWDNRTLNVRFLQPKSGPTLEAGPISNPVKVIGPRPDGCTTVYVGNLAYDITEEVLRKVLDKCGSIRAIRFAEHIQTKEFRGFGYVQFHDESSCEAAIQFNGMVVMGRPMHIDYGARDEGYTQAREELQKKLKKGICHKFQTGQCTRGDTCKFAHIGQDQDAEELVQGIKGTVTRDASLETAVFAESEETKRSDAPVCINFQKGKCKRGASCNFQHLQGCAEVKKGAGDDTSGTNETSDVPVCQNFQKGKCKRGEACRFRHVAALPEPRKEAIGPIRVALPVTAVAQVAICRHFQKGQCGRGTSCRLAHTEVVQAALGTAVEEVSEYQKRFQSVCYNWQRSGSCERGEKCPFQHDGAFVAQEEDVVAVKKQKREKRDSNRLLADDEGDKPHKKRKKRQEGTKTQEA